MFVPIKTTDGGLFPWEYIPAEEGEYSAGEMLTVENGMVKKLPKCSREFPCYLCMCDVSVSSGKVIPCTRVESRIIYETSIYTGVDELRPGVRMVVIKGLGVVPGNGSFEVIEASGGRPGDIVKGKFVFEQDKNHSTDTKEKNAGHMQLITNAFTQEQLLRQLAEEAAELSQAALKLIRAHEGTTPVTVEEATANLIEECADVQLCVKALENAGVLEDGEISKMVFDKLNRWAERAENHLNKQVERDTM